MSHFNQMLGANKTSLVRVNSLYKESSLARLD
jgi:hypothetical protein